MTHGIGVVTVQTGLRVIMIRSLVNLAVVNSVTSAWLRTKPVTVTREAGKGSIALFSNTAFFTFL